MVAPVLVDAITTARTPDGLIMALAHRSWPVFGVQFHPESILTLHGDRILRNVLEDAREAKAMIPPHDFVGRGTTRRVVEG